MEIGNQVKFRNGEIVTIAGRKVSMDITRNINGAIKIDGKSIDMYRFTALLHKYNEINGTTFRPSTIPDAIVKLIIEEITERNL